MAVINGKKENAGGRSLEEYLKEKGYPQAGLAVEINGVIVKKSEYAGRLIADEDVIEIVSFFGGG
ncbi:MAG: sulfur carrier protein ThiS [Ruminococcus sp.]|nr:sulfur carrier protein ThiS [Ruminococcus sp.]